VYTDIRQEQTNTKAQTQLKFTKHLTQ